MRAELNRKKCFTRRALMIGAGKAALISVLGARLYYLQILEGGTYATLSDNNRIKLRLLAPARGRLLDRNGVPMAENAGNYRLFYDPADETEKFSDISDKLQSILHLRQEEFTVILEAIKERPRKAAPVMLTDHLSWQEVATLEVNKTELPGLLIDAGQVRHYPFAESTSHVTGYLGLIADEEEKDTPLVRLPDFKIGKNGAEKAAEQWLRGKVGMQQLEVDAHGLMVRELSQQPSITGEDVKLTIDMELQKLAVEKLGAESGGAVVMNVQNGDVLALASQPGFDPNRFSRRIMSDYWKALNSDPKSPLLNKVLAGQYPPGSTFKMLVALAALAEKEAVPEGTVYCPGFLKLGNHTFHCWKRQGHGHMDMRSAIQQSCDVYFYTLGMRLGIEPIADMARKFGLGSKSGIELPGERPGLVPDQHWKRKISNQPWMTGETVNCSIGQGYVLATPMQLAVMASRLANGGKAVIPRILLPQKENTPEPVFRTLGVPQSHLQVIMEGMSSVVNSQRGTAYASRLPPPYTMAGKTGTSQVQRLTTRTKGPVIPWEERHHAWFVGFAPLEAPRFAAAVLIEHGESGAKASAPIVKELLLKVQQLYPLQIP